MSSVYLRRRAVALGTVLGLLFVVVAAAVGESSSPFGAAVDFSLGPAQKAKLPWRQRYVSGSAGPLDGRGLPATPAQRAGVARLHRLGLPIYCGGGRGNYVGLSFDDGPTQYSDRVLALLQRAGAQATFFLIGQVVGARPEVLRRQVDQGGVADHTWTHSSLTKLADPQVRSELLDTQRLLERTTGRRVDLMRPPYGARDARTDRAATRLGMVPIVWDVDTRDSAGASSDQIVANAEAGLRPGNIILMHDTYDRTLAALPRILAAAKHKGLRLVSISQLLALDPPTEAQVRAGGAGCAERQRFHREQDATAMRLNNPA